MENEEWSGIARRCQIVTEQTIREGCGTVALALVLVFANLTATLVTILLLLLCFCYLKQYKLSLIIMLNNWLLFYLCC